jgi:citrate synthase
MDSFAGMSAKEAADKLGVSVQTLYAYVSRGMIRSREGESRTRIYSSADIDGLMQKKAPPATSWSTFGGISSSVTSILFGKLSYRGRSAVELAETATFEEVAELLWTGDIPLDSTLFHERLEPSERTRAVATCVAGADPALQMAVLAPLLDEDDPDALFQDQSLVVGARILTFFSSLVGDQGASVAEKVATAWGRPEAVRDVQSALILCADHELNVSTFTARCVASAGSTLYASVGAGLAALNGPKHGGATKRVKALLRDLRAAQSLERELAERLARGEQVPGFGHELYPDGDPRGAKLLELAGGAGESFAVEAVETLRRRTGKHPNVDFGLVALCEAWNLPDNAPFTLFALGRTAGWIAHAIEEHSRDTLIRPRARYAE